MEEECEKINPNSSGHLVSLPPPVIKLLKRKWEGKNSSVSPRITEYGVSNQNCHLSGSVVIERSRSCQKKRRKNRPFNERKNKDHIAMCILSREFRQIKKHMNNFEFGNPVYHFDTISIHEHKIIIIFFDPLCVFSSNGCKRKYYVKCFIH